MPFLSWLLTALFSFFQFFMQVCANLMVLPWMQQFQASTTSVSLISSAFYSGYVLMQIPAGMLFDRFGIRSVLRIASLVFLTGMMLFLFSHEVIWAILARFIMGAGAGFAFVGMVYGTSLWFHPARFTLMLGLGEMIAMLGVALLEAWMPHLLLGLGYSNVMRVLVVVAIIQTLLIFRYLRDPIKPLLSHNIKLGQGISAQIFFQRFLEVLANKNIWYAGFFCCSTFGVVSIFAALWGNNFIQIMYQQSYVNASLLISLILVGIAVGGPIIGYVNERYASCKSLMLLNLSILVLLSFLLLAGKFNIVGLMLALFAMGFLGSSYVLGFYVTQESIGLKSRGVGIGLCNAIALLGGMIFQPLTGFILAKMSVHMQLAKAYQWAILVVPIVMILALLLTALLDLPREKMNKV